jgi:hypothetical protein
MMVDSTAFLANNRQSLSLQTLFGKARDVLLHKRLFYSRRLKWVTMAYTVAYYLTAIITAIKCLMIQARGRQ